MVPNVAEPKVDPLAPMQLLVISVLPSGFKMDIATEQLPNVEFDV